MSCWIFAQDIRQAIFKIDRRELIFKSILVPVTTKKLSWLSTNPKRFSCERWDKLPLVSFPLFMISVMFVDFATTVLFSTLSLLISLLVLLAVLWALVFFFESFFLLLVFCFFPVSLCSASLCFFVLNNLLDFVAFWGLLLEDLAAQIAIITRRINKMLNLIFKASEFAEEILL